MRFVLIALLATALAPPQVQLALLPADETALVNAASKLRDAIVAEDIGAILGLVSHSGLGCTDTIYSREQVEADLKSSSGYLHRSLFDTARFAAECGAAYSTEFPWISDRDFFLADNSLRMEIKVIAENEAQVVFFPSVPNHYPREHDFRKEGDSWRLIYGLIVCGCSCG